MTPDDLLRLVWRRLPAVMDAVGGEIPAVRQQLQHGRPLLQPHRIRHARACTARIVIRTLALSTVVPML